MRHRWFTMIVVGAITMLIAGPVLAQGTGSGTSAPSGSGSSSGTTTQPSPSATQPSPSTSQPSAGTPMPPSSGKAQPGMSQGSSGTETPSKSSAGSKPGMTNGQAGTSGKSGSDQAQGGPEQIKKVQKALQEKGADPGPIDGIMGPKTEAALKSFQKDEKLPETGRLDSQTLAKLGVSAQ